MSLDDTVAFVNVARAGSFTAAAKALGVPKATLSRRVARLEERLGARLLHRTTRKLGLTDVGRAYYGRCLRAVEEIEDAERVAADVAAAPRGLLRVTSSFDFGRDHLGGWLAEFHARYPRIRLSLELTQRRVDLVEEGVDIAIRGGGPLEESSLVARRLADSPLVLAASPAYVKRRGTPKSLAELRGHEGLAFGPAARLRLTGPEGPADVELDAWLVTNEFGVLRRAALDGLGIALLFEPWAREDFRAKRLVPVLPAYRLEGGGLFAVYPSAHHLTPKVRVFIDFLVEKLAESGFAPRARA